MYNKLTQIQSNTEAGNGIEFIALAKTIWKSRRILFICLLAGAILGVLVAISSSDEYTAKTIMVPQTTSKGQSQLGGLAALAGLNIDLTQSSDLSPAIYPFVVSSVPFKLELMNTPIKFKEFDKEISLFDYYTKYKKTSTLGIIKKYTIGLPGVIIGALKGKPKELILSKNTPGQPLVLSEDQYAISNMLDNIITLEVEPKDGYLTLTANMPEALAAAQLAKKAQELLQRNITNFKIEKAKADLEFIQERYNVVKSEAEGFKVKLVVKSDRFKNLTSNLPQVETSQIETKFNIANTVFQDLAKQLEQAKIKVKKDTPVFTIIEPATVPNEKSKPKRPLILLIFIFFGGISGVILIFGKNYLKNSKQIEISKNIDS